MKVEAFSWPLARLGEGIAALARQARLHSANSAASDALVLPNEVPQSALPALERWLEWAASRLGLEAEAVTTAVPDFAQLLRRGGPLLLHLHDPQLGRRFVLLLASAGAAHVRLIGPDLQVQRCPIAALRAAVCAAFEAPLTPEIDRLLDAAQVAPARRASVRALLLAQRLAAVEVPGCWLLRAPAHTHFWRQLVQAKLPHRVGLILALFALIYSLEIGAWRVIGQATLDGRLDTGWLMAWVLLVLSLLPLRALSGWLDTSFTLDTARILKQRLLAGALRLDLDTQRQMGSGQLLGRVMESQALEGMALSGGLASLVALLELGFAAWILGHGAAAALHLSLLLSWLLLTAALAGRYFKRLRHWTGMRLDMTNDLVERMVGHRTGLAQEQGTRRDNADDMRMQSYLDSSRQMDGAITPIVAAAPGGWIVLALAALAPAFVDGTASPGVLAISLGGILFAHRALGGLTGGLSSLARAALAWRRVAAIFEAGAQPASTGPYVSPALFHRPSDHPTRELAPPLIDASQLVFRYREQGAPVLRGVDLRIKAGERVLLQGESGGGKSTLAALLVGLRRPHSGLLLLAGLDRQTLGDSWHRLATEAPQFHENHVLSGSLGFNLLMGREWPGSAEDLQEAQTLCEELGLGELLARMPAGLMQRVGETGWQLSHGERSRIFLARALLQKAPLTVLDESFGALDPQTLQRCLACAWRRSATLVVIAHP